MAEYEAARISAVPEGEARGFSVGGREIVLCNVEGEIYALQGMCSHEELPLDGAEVEDGVLTCDWHGASFDACTGRVLGLPATSPLRTYDTRVEDGRVFVTLPD
ncbi:MAG TPA: non-heme iron oxygenase ferredoxin subunit [Longimicrobium sp.]|nr:non-heme iron oxygenase ferredoxin subunit [Longimicrobium sp.]